MSCETLVEDVSRPAAIESDDSLVVSTTEVSVLHMFGPLSSCQVWFDVPFEFLRGCVLRAYAVVGSARAKLAEVDLKDLGPETVNGRGSGVAFTIHGQPATAYEVTAQRAAGSSSGGRFFARAWVGAEGTASVTVGAPRATRGNAYGATTEVVDSQLDENDETSIAYLFHAGGPQRVEIERILVSYVGASDGGYATVRGARLAGEYSSPGGDVVDDVDALDPAHAASSAYVVYGATNAPTRITPDVFCAVVPGTVQGTFEWTADSGGGPIVLRAGRCEGFEVRVKVEADLDDPIHFTVTYFWRELEETPVDLAHYGFIHEWRADQGAPTTGDVASWTDRLSGVVLAGGTNKPAIGSDDDGPYIEFVAAASERLDVEEFPFDGAEDYTIVAAIRNEDVGGSIVHLYGTTAIVEIAYATGVAFQHNIADDGTGDDTAAVGELRFVWTVLIIRRDGDLIKARVGGVNGTPVGVTLGDVTLASLRLGAPGSASTSGDYIDMRMRHLAIAKRALSDDECVAVEGLMATYWNIR